MQNLKGKLAAYPYQSKNNREKEHIMRKKSTQTLKSNPLLIACGMCPGHFQFTTDREAFILRTDSWKCNIALVNQKCTTTFTMATVAYSSCIDIPCSAFHSLPKHSPSYSSWYRITSRDRSPVKCKCNSLVINYLKHDKINTECAIMRQA